MEPEHDLKKHVIFSITDKVHQTRIPTGNKNKRQTKRKCKSN